MTWPRRVIVRAAQIQGEREAEARLTALTDASIAAGLKLGQEYVDPQAKRVSGGPYYSLAPLSLHRETLERVARPWLHTPDAVRRRRETEEAAMWEKAMQAMGAGVRA